MDSRKGRPMSSSGGQGSRGFAQSHPSKSGYRHSRFQSFMGPTQVGSRRPAPAQHCHLAVQGRRVRPTPGPGSWLWRMTLRATCGTFSGQPRDHQPQCFLAPQAWGSEKGASHCRPIAGSSKIKVWASLHSPRNLRGRSSWLFQLPVAPGVLTLWPVLSVFKWPARLLGSLSVSSKDTSD